MPTVLGIDIGTQSVKVVFYDAEAHTCAAVASAPLELHQTNSGVAEQQADWWVQALRIALQQVDQSVREAVLAVGVSGQQHGFVPLDKSGQVLAKVKLWCDTSTGAECDQVTADFGGVDECIAETGNPVLPGYTASKVRWFRNAHPDLYAKMDCILLPHDYLNFYLTGERRMEAGDASGTGFLDIRNRQWSEKMLRAIDPRRDLRDCLPDVELQNKTIGTLLPAVADELGLPSKTPVSIGGGDNMMGAIGTGNVTAGIVTMSLGTSGTVYAYSDTPIVDPEGNIAAFCSSTGGWLPLLCTMNCTVGTELMRDLFKVDLPTFEAQLAAAGHGADGMITVPFFNGERTPNLPNAKGCILGMDSRNMRTENFLRSAVESATFGLRFGLNGLAERGIEANEIVLTGGGASSDIWRQIVADICNAPVTVLKHDEGAALGAALQALAMLNGEGMVNLADEHLQPDVERCCEPRPSAVDSYNQIYQTYQRAVGQVAQFYL